MRKKILFVIPALVGGGAEKVMLLLLQELNRDRFHPQLLVFENQNDYPTETPTDVNLISLNKKGRWDNFRLVFSLAKVFKTEKPDLLCSFLTYTNWLTLLARMVSGLPIPLVISERSHLTKNLTQQKFKSVRRWLIRSLYPKANAIVCISKGIETDLISNFGVRPEQCKVIYNPIDINHTQTLSQESTDFPWFQEKIPVLIACGRLTRQKNFELLLKTFAILLKTTPVRLLILGKGELETELKKMAAQLRVSEQVAFLGFQPNPFKYMARAQAFVLSSSWEGFGNVIIEAMACGIPVIATRCPSGPDEIITDGVNGRLVPTEDAFQLAETIKELLQDPALRNRLAAQGLRRANDFSIVQKVNEYETLFSTLGEV
ncbi:MAG: glycosyltransferase [bacterium]|nr:glycosyltransferase [bacterium]